MCTPDLGAKLVEYRLPIWKVRYSNPRRPMTYKGYTCRLAWCLALPGYYFYFGNETGLLNEASTCFPS